MKFQRILTAVLIVLLLAHPLYARRTNKKRDLEISVREGKEFYEEKYYMGPLRNGPRC